MWYNMSKNVGRGYIMKVINELDIKDKNVLIRCDFNVPIKDGNITDNTRIVSSLKTISYAIDNHAKKIILFSHLGRVKTEEDLNKYDLSLVAGELSKLLNEEVLFVNATRGELVDKALSSKSRVILLQNTRYEDLDGKKESTNDEELGKYWASLGDVFINDAFGTSHRAHASNVGIANHINEKAIGFLIEKELKALEELNQPEHPFTVILGGAKVSDKIKVIENLVTKADNILIGGGMAFTFLKAKGYEIGKSLVDEENIDFCKKLINEYPDKIVLPIDVRLSKEYKDNPAVIKSVSEINLDEMGLDIGPETEELFKDILVKSNLVLWNGPLGVYEFEHYKISTENLLTYIVENDIKTILGGGDIVAAAKKLRGKEKIHHISTGGGATLEFLEGKELPGIKSIY